MDIEISNSYDLLVFLKLKNLLKNITNELWWDSAGSFEVVISAILVQNTKWNNVKIALKNLKDYDILDLESLAKIDSLILKNLIKPCGFYNQKAIYIQNLCKNIINFFGDFENFRDSVDREWLLTQKGLGKESADGILNYVCFREIMVVDRYTQKLLAKFGYEFDSYDEIQNFLQNGIIQNYSKVVELYGYEIPLYKVYARFHAKIVEFSKNYRAK